MDLNTEEEIDLLNERMKVNLNIPQRASESTSTNNHSPDKNSDQTETQSDPGSESESESDPQPEDEDDPELSELLRLVECPVCKEAPCPPIYNCCNGHFVCASCRPQLRSQHCVYCHATFTKVRNYPLESLITTPAVSCDFVKYGCPERKLSLIQYEPHVMKCWAKLWRPGKISLNKNYKKARPKDQDTFYNDDVDLSPCRKCYYENPMRKIKCQNCDSSLRTPTPMYV